MFDASVHPTAIFPRVRFIPNDGCCFWRMLATFRIRIRFFGFDIVVMALNFILVSASDKEFKGKKGALSIGIKNATHNFIVITDADCKPDSNWLNAIAGALDYGYDFVFGVAPIESGTRLIEKISAYENLRNTYLTIAAVGLNKPYSAAARSFAFRKKSFERIGGYANTTETLSGDDDLLIREAVKNKML